MTKRFLLIATLLTSFVAFMILFILITFPFGLIKESLILQVSEQLGQPVEIEKLSVGLPLTISLSRVVLEQHQQTTGENRESLRFHRIATKLKVSHLLIGRLTLQLQLYSKKNSKKTKTGYLDLEVQFRLVDLFRRNTLPAKIKLSARQFPLTNILRYAIDAYVASPQANALVKPLLKQLLFKGYLQSQSEITFNNNQVTSVAG
ncbi:MAG: hypothetical protein OXC40_02990, partial [Proteobacteria bacterium]|nr:hypothetical protein [Pseudomonadota bacterium]